MKRVKFAKIDKQAPLIVVPAKVNSLGRLRFLLDTGATHSCVTPQLVERLGVYSHGNAMALGAGGTMNLELVRIDSLEVGGAVVKRLTMAIVNVDHVSKLTRRIDGVLGNDFMKRFKVTIDYAKATVTFA
ncbi:MAG: clan AA aspartic protease [Myxococcaceae bacterium]|nr:clan AA aspartic protease [Myxococcaceae bacterium]